MGYTVKVVAAKTGLSPNTLRYYEKEGLLPHVQRSKSGIRHYSNDDLEWLDVISCLKNTGMSIKQIRDFVNLSQQGPETLKERRGMLFAHRQEVEGRIQKMQQHLKRVSQKIEHITRQYEEYGAENKETFADHADAAGKALSIAND